VRELAKKANVTANTVTRIENGADAKQSTVDRLEQALEAAGVEFIDENGGGPGGAAKEAPTEKTLGLTLSHGPANRITKRIHLIDLRTKGGA
jgi:transcriptional regulator with XRE-family HTH domain